MITSNKFPASKPLIYGLLYAPNDETQSLMNSKNPLFPASIPEIHSNAKNPILMAKAFKDAVISGRSSFLAGRMSKNYFAIPSSPKKGLI